MCFHNAVSDGSGLVIVLDGVLQEIVPAEKSPCACPADICFGGTGNRCGLSL
jgi:hypothetical protein